MYNNRMFIAITTFGKPEHIYGQLMNLYDKKHFYLVHYNKREKRSNLMKLRKMFSGYQNVKVISKYRVYWGEYSIAKSILYSMKYFNKINKTMGGAFKSFIHLGAKEINLKPISYIEEYVEKNNYCSMNFSNKYENWYEINFNKIYLSNKEIYDYTPFHTHKWFHYINRYKHINKLNYIIIIFYAIYDNFFSKNLFKILINIFKKNIKNIMKYGFYNWSQFNDLNDDDFTQLSYKLKKIPRKLKSIEWIKRGNGPYLILNSDSVEKILSYKNLNTFLKYTKNLFAPEEIIFKTLFYNLVEKTDYPYSILWTSDKANTPPDIPNFIDLKDVLFMRRFIGTNDDIESFKKIHINLFVNEK